MNIPTPIFEKNITTASWEKIYEREYGVQYSEVAVSLFSYATYHFPNTSTFQVIIPGSGKNTAFYIDAKSWIKLVEGLNNKYTSHVKSLETYEKQFIFDGENYLKTAKDIFTQDLHSLSNKELLTLFIDHQEKRYKYSCFAWSAFILNNYVADRATKIIDKYITKYNKENEKQDIYDSLFSPHKRAAILELQYQVQKHKGELTKSQFQHLYEKFKWLSCLDIQNIPWTEDEFKKQIEPFTTSTHKKIYSFKEYKKELQINEKDLEYLLMAKRFVYIKDARDDYRRESLVFYAQSLFAEIAQRMNINTSDTSYLQEKEIIDFLSIKKPIEIQTLNERKKGFVMYLDINNQIVCLQGKDVNTSLALFGLNKLEEKRIEITGRVASQGNAKGKVKIIQGVNDLNKIEVGDVLVALTTHPDFVSAMRKAVAIVTDEGGITSHAAIVSREFSIPCIVGCKNATKLLKDGDFVEVNAIEGRIIKIT